MKKASGLAIVIAIFIAIAIPAITDNWFNLTWSWLPAIIIGNLIESKTNNL